MRRRWVWLCTTALNTCLGFVTNVQAADLVNPQKEVKIHSGVDTPRISGGGGVIGAYGCTFDGNASGGLLGQIALPLDQAHGLQFDGLLGVNSDGKLAGQANGHLFWRDPNMGLAGLYGSYVHNDQDTDGVRLGVEGEVYFDQASLSAIAGWNFGADEIFAQTRASYYLTDNTKVYAGYLYEGRHIGAVGAEHLFDNSRISVFAEGRMGENGYKAAFAGLKLHLGGKAPAASTNANDYTLADVKDQTPPSSDAKKIRHSKNNDAKPLIAIDREDIIPLWVQLCGSNPGSDPTITPDPSITPKQTVIPGPGIAVEPTITPKQTVIPGPGIAVEPTISCVSTTSCVPSIEP